jgi:dihydroflavonol-4-reductase
MIVVTGGTGLLGSHLLLRLVQNNKPVRALIRRGTEPEKVLQVWKYYVPDPKKVFQKVDWHICDMQNRAALYDAIQSVQPQQVFHCAAVVSFNPRRRREIWDANITLTRNLVNCCLELNTGKLIHVSSVAAIGKPQGNEPADETCGWPVKPGSVYAKTKTLGELEVWRGIREGLNAVIVNPSVILGPGNRKSGSPLIFDTIYRGLKFYPGGITGFVDVHDVIDIMVQLAESEISGERFIINGANTGYRELFGKIATAFHKKPPRYLITPFMTSIAWKLEWLLTLVTGREPRVTRQSARSAHAVQHYSSKKIIDKLGYSFRQLNETIQHVVTCYLKEKEGI